MPQINLLSTENKQSRLPWEILLTVLVRLLVMAFIAMLGYYAFLYYSSKTVASSIFKKQNDIIALQNDILNREGRKELLIRQAQLAEVKRLLDGHLYWSKFLPELAKTTLNTTSYLSLTADNKGVARLTVVAPNYVEFDKFLQVFDSKDFKGKFSDVQVLGVSKYQIEEISGIKFEVALKFDQSFLKENL